MSFPLAELNLVVAVKHDYLLVHHLGAEKLTDYYYYYLILRDNWLVGMFLELWQVLALTDFLEDKHLGIVKLLACHKSEFQKQEELVKGKRAEEGFQELEVAQILVLENLGEAMEQGLVPNQVDVGFLALPLDNLVPGVQKGHNREYKEALLVIYHQAKREHFLVLVLILLS